MKLYGNKVTDFYDKETPKMDCNHPCLVVINSNSAFQKDQRYYLDVFLKECKYIERKVVMHIVDDLKNSFDDSDDSDGEYFFL